MDKHVGGKMKRALFALLVCGVLLFAGNREAEANLYGVLSETSPSFSCCTPGATNYLWHAFVMPGLSWQPSMSTAWGALYGALYSSGGGNVGLNRVFAKVLLVGTSYHAQWDLWWDDGAGHQQASINSVSATAYPGDTVYMEWRGAGWGSASYTAYITVTRPDGSQRAFTSSASGAFHFVTSQLPNAVARPAFEFGTNGTCVDLPAPNDDVNYIGTMNYDAMWGDDNGLHAGFFGIASNYRWTAPVCDIQWNVAGTTSTLQWHAH